MLTNTQSMKALLWPLLNSRRKPQLWGKGCITIRIARPGQSVSLAV